MSKASEKLYEQIWDEHNARDHEVSLDAVDADFIARVIIDLDEARETACKDARRAVDRKRTKFQTGQLAFPTMADDNEYLVIADAVRVQKAKALDPDFLASLELSDENLKRQFDANQAKHAYYRLLAPYLHQGMTHNMAVSAWQRDHSDDRAAD